MTTAASRSFGRHGSVMNQCLCLSGHGCPPPQLKDLKKLKRENFRCRTAEELQEDFWRSLCVDAAVKSEAIGREVMDGNGFSRVMALTFFNVSEDSY